MPSPSRRDGQRQAVLAASRGRAHAGTESRSRFAVFAAAAVMLLVAVFLSARMWSPLVSDVQAAVRFEVRLAEEKPAPGLREAKVTDSGRSVYLHDETIVTNSDIASAQAVPGDGSAQYRVNIEFTPSGAEKMRAATGNHIGKPVAILLDGQVVMAPVVRTSIAGSAMITGNFTRDQAEKIASGISTQ
jgi:preprotein translocase subunit SecD